MNKSIILLLLIFAIGCSKEDANITPEKKTLNLDLPNNSSVPYSTIGRVLFYDTRLSENNAISCASCHKQSLGFSDNVAFSTGFQGHKTLRNSIAIDGLSGGAGGSFANKSLFWDGREENINDMIVMPILNHVEMGMTDKDALVERVKNTGYYQELFSKAGIHEIDIEQIATCLVAFVVKIQNNNSKADLANNNIEQLSGLEESGRHLFFDIYPCGSCHQAGSPYSMVSSEFINIGLDKTSADPGRGAITQTSYDNGKFKVPSLKNIALSAPYMHDGRFQTLDEVLDHYSHGINNDPNLDFRLRDMNGNPLTLNISESQKKALIAFLNTMTDTKTITADNLSDPFIH